MPAAGQPRATRLPRSRNAWLALGAAVLAAAQLPNLAAATVRFVDALDYSGELRLEIAYGLGLAAPIVAALGWLLAARALAAARIDLRRMALPAALVGIAAATSLVASGLELLVVRDGPSPREYLLIFWLQGAADLFTVGAAALAWLALRRRDRVSRGRWLALAAVTMAVAAGLDVADAVAQKNFYADFTAAPGQLAVGLVFLAAGAAFFALAAALAARPFFAAGERREAFLAAAAGLAAAGFGVGVVGGCFVASAFASFSSAEHTGTADWIEVGYQVGAALALACVAAGARTAAKARGSGADLPPTVRT